MARILLVLCCAVLAGSCSRISAESRSDYAADIARKAGLRYSEVDTSLFTLAAYSRLGSSVDISVYIEGDGFAYVTPWRLSSDPTPLTPTALILAAADPAESVVYLARPCQFVDLRNERNCSDKYWSSHRFAEEVISSYDQVLNRIKKSARGTKFHLVGYSGGGAVAVLLAARRDDIKSLRTVAGYLDHVALNEAKGVAPLWGSLDPIKVAASLAGVPQVHYSGGRDKVIPRWVSKSFMKMVGDSVCARSVTVDQAGHESGWKEFWRLESGTKPACY